MISMPRTRPETTWCSVSVIHPAPIRLLPTLFQPLQIGQGHPGQSHLSGHASGLKAVSRHMAVPPGQLAITNSNFDSEIPACQATKYQTPTEPHRSPGSARPMTFE